MCFGRFPMTSKAANMDWNRFSEDVSIRGGVREGRAVRGAFEKAFVHNVAGRPYSRLALAITVSSALTEYRKGRSNESADTVLRAGMTAVFAIETKPLDPDKLRSAKDL